MSFEISIFTHSIVLRTDKIPFKKRTELEKRLSNDELFGYTDLSEFALKERLNKSYSFDQFNNVVTIFNEILPDFHDIYLHVLRYTNSNNRLKQIELAVSRENYDIAYDIATKKEDILYHDAPIFSSSGDIVCSIQNPTRKRI